MICTLMDKGIKFLFNRKHWIVVEISGCKIRLWFLFIVLNFAAVVDGSIEWIISFCI